MLDCFESLHCPLGGIARHDELVDMCIAFAGEYLPPDIERFECGSAILVESL